MSKIYYPIDFLDDYVREFSFGGFVLFVLSMLIVAMFSMMISDGMSRSDAVWSQTCTINVQSGNAQVVCPDKTTVDAPKMVPLTALVQAVEGKPISVSCSAKRKSFSTETAIVCDVDK